MRYFICGVLLCAFLASGCVKPEPGFRNEPAEFRGIRWGTDIKEVQSVMVEAKISEYMYQTSGVKVYIRKAEPLSMENVPLNAVLYCFYKGRFFMVLVEFSGRPAFEGLGRQLAVSYGKGHENKRAGSVEWTGKDVDILLVGEGKLMYLYKPINAEKEKDRAGK